MIMIRISFIVSPSQNVSQDQYKVLNIVAQRSTRGPRVQRRRHRRPPHAGHGRGRLPRLSSHGAVHHTGDTGEGAGAERGVWEH